VRVNPDLSTYSVDTLLRAAYSLTHRMTGSRKSDEERRAQRDLIDEEIKRRCGE
jgi:hypothetical protein